MAEDCDPSQTDCLSPEQCVPLVHADPVSQTSLNIIPAHLCTAHCSYRISEALAHTTPNLANKFKHHTCTSLYRTLFISHTTVCGVTPYALRVTLHSSAIIGQFLPRTGDGEVCQLRRITISLMGEVASPFLTRESGDGLSEVAVVHVFMMTMIVIACCGCNK